jgi:hypothetical protein
MTYQIGQIVKEENTGKIIKVEHIDIVEDFTVMIGTRLKKDLTEDKRKWSQKEVITASEGQNCTILN